jgi:hypothetical protein
MEYTTVLLALLGFAVGIMFRLQVLLLVAVLLVPVTIVFARFNGFGFLGVGSTIMVAQTIVQASYFWGLVARTALGAAYRARPIF